MPVYKSKEQTKDGRSWFFKCQYKDAYGETHPKKIKKIYPIFDTFKKKYRIRPYKT